MANKNTIVMSWRQCKLEFGRTQPNGSFAKKLFSIGILNDKGTSLEYEEGDTYTAKASGGVTVAEEKGEGTYSIKTRVKEMKLSTLAYILGKNVEAETTATGGDIVHAETLSIPTTAITDEFSVKVTPKNIGAKGIKVCRTSISIVPGISEDEGFYIDVTFKQLSGEDTDFFKFYNVVAEDWSVKHTLPTPADNENNDTPAPASNTVLSAPKTSVTGSK